jgi:LysR family glycine cleavage system transcriptional activator
VIFERQHLPLHALRTFEVAARYCNFVRAAESLGVTHGAVSHQIKSLELQVGKPLFDRGRRPMSLTPAGEQLLGVVSNAFDRLAKAATAVRRGELEGDVTLACVPGLAANWLPAVLSEFLATHANITIRIVTEYWRHPTMAEQSDLAIAYGSGDYPGKRVVLLGHSHFFPVAQPELVTSTRGTIRAVDLLRYPLLHEYTEETWSRWFAAAGLSDVDTGRGLFFDGAHLTLQAARQGCGIAMGDMPTIAQDLVSNRLVRLFDLSVPAAFPYYLISAPERDTNPAVAALERWILDRFSALEAKK